MCQGLLPSRRHIEKREDPGDEVGTPPACALSQAWPLVLTLFSLQACDGGDFEELVRF